MEQDLSTYISKKVITGTHDDGQAWQGIQVSIDLNNKDIQFGIEYGISRPKAIEDYARQFGRRNRAHSIIAWSAGKAISKDILDKNRFPEYFLGAPVGLLVSKGEVMGTPGFNKPALLISKTGDMRIERLDTSNGIKVSCRSRKVDFLPAVRNLDGIKNDLPAFCFYDSLYEKDEILGDGRVIVRMSGNIVKEIINTKKNQMVKLKPTGITLSIDDDAFPATWDMREKELIMTILGLDDVEYAIEGGPMLLEKGTEVLDLKTEGWQTEQSEMLYTTNTGYSNDRAPRMVLAMDDKKQLSVILISKNETSVGATLAELAVYLKQEKMQDAMILNPDGQATLLIGDELVSTEPENSKFEVYSSVIGYVKKQATN